jgi:hypothetical protein
VFSHCYLGNEDAEEEERRMSRDFESKVVCSKRPHHDFILLWGALDKYAYDHNGLLLNSLEGLVPDYLHKLPKDPFVDQSNLSAPENEGKPSSKEVLGYRYRPGGPGNRAWIISSVGLPEFPYQSANTNGLYITRGMWMSGINPLWMKPKTLYTKR